MKPSYPINRSYVLLEKGASAYSVVNLASGRASRHDYTAKHFCRSYHVKPYNVSVRDGYTLVDALLVS
jgi:hypothetical protein